MFFRYEEIVKRQEVANKKLEEIKNNIPKKNKYEKELQGIYDENYILKEQNKRVRETMYELQKINNDLINYIKKIDEVKEAGGVKEVAKEYFNPLDFTVCEYKEIIIPEIKVIRLKEWKNNDNSKSR